MSTASERSEHDLESVMADYLQQLEDGGKPEPAVFLRDYPQFAEDLRSFFRNHHWLGEAELEDSSSTLIGSMIGPYTIESEIARGGMGVVYKARQAGLDRPVALKLIGSGVLASREERRRFRIEAEAAAGLNHPGIVPIYEIGSWQGYEYFSMALVDGPTLQEKVEGQRLEPEQAAGVVVEIARAVAYAHQAGILHRDLKPDNILLSDCGTPMLTDFGLAKWHREGTMLTRTGQVLGTPNYMSPQQASGQADVNELSDVYSLGGILYALLTGQPPHQGTSAAEVLRSVLQDEPKSPRAICREIPTSLENICLKAIAKDASERYRSAAALADDLQCFLTGDSIAADESGLLGQVARELRRDQHQQFFVRWGGTLMVIGGIIFTAHLAIFILNLLGLPRWVAFWIPRAAMFVAIGSLIYYAREGQMTPRTIAERPVYSIWLAYLAALAVINTLVFLGVIDSDALFPITSTLSGFGFLAMSGHVWGGAAVMGFGFLALALVLPFVGLASSLLFGTAWLISLVVLAGHYQRLPSSQAG